MTRARLPPDTLGVPEASPALHHDRQRPGLVAVEDEDVADLQVEEAGEGEVGASEDALDLDRDLGHLPRQRLREALVGPLREAAGEARRALAGSTARTG